MPVMIAPVNQDLKVIKILTDEKTKKHLENLGIVIGGKIKVLTSTGGTVVLLIKESRLALDSSISTKIFVACA